MVCDHPHPSGKPLDCNTAIINGLLPRVNTQDATFSKCAGRDRFAGKFDPMFWWLWIATDIGDRSAPTLSMPAPILHVP
jgi:hypothetical protein